MSLKAEYITHMGDDLMVVDAARVSFNKLSTAVQFKDAMVRISDTYANRIRVPVLNEKDQKLINYLAKHKHKSPFFHPQVQFRITAPIFIANQLKRHQVGLALNEISRRYVDDDPEFYTPEKWRLRPEGGIKQGSSDKTMGLGVPCTYYEDPTKECNGEPHHITYSAFLKIAEGLYKDMIDCNIAPEMARMVLPQSMFTEWIWTGSLYSWHNMCKLRLKPDAQYENRVIVQQIDDVMQGLFPVSWMALKTKGEGLKADTVKAADFIP